MTRVLVGSVAPDLEGPCYFLLCIICWGPTYIGDGDLADLRAGAYLICEDCLPHPSLMPALLRTLTARAVGETN